jgi:hypothetical protein
VTRNGADPHLARITVYPIKSLDGVDRERARLVAGAALERDREYALFDAEGRYVNGKRERAVHRLRSEFDVETRELRLASPDRGERTFDLAVEGDAGDAAGEEAGTDGRPRDADALTEWLSDYFDYPVSLRRDDAGGFPDDTVASGPTVVSTATIREVASWFPDVEPDGMRRRLRANLEIGGVPAFWEDRLFVDRDHVRAFSVGDVTLEGVNPCQRCVVPSRDPDTGEETPDFRTRFMRRREETMPEWSGGDWFDHTFRLMVNTRPDRESDVVGRELAVGDPISIGETRPAPEPVDA